MQNTKEEIDMSEEPPCDYFDDDTNETKTYPYKELSCQTLSKIRGKAEACREYMSEIKHLTYLIDSYDALNETADQLCKIVQALKAIARKDNGLLLKDTEKKKPQSRKTLQMSSKKKIR